MDTLSARRVAGFGTSIFSEITLLALQYHAVNLGQGFPDFAGPEFIKQAAARAIAADLNQYAPSAGLIQLREAVAAEWQRQYGQTIDPVNEVTVTTGATEGLFAAMQAMLDPGDHVIVFEPAYDSYAPDITMAGGHVLPVRLYPPDWHFDPYQLRAAFARRPKLLLLNTPHNPTGKVFSLSELEQIAALCQEYQVIAITDEVYQHLVYDAAVHISLATLPGMWERTLTLNSIGKTFSVTGWKVGYAVGPAALNQALRQSHQWITFATATPFQAAAATAIEEAARSGYYTCLRDEYDTRRLHLRQILVDAGLAPLPVEGSFFIVADFAGFGYPDDRSFCHYLIREAGVAAIPVSAFYINQAGVPPLIRFCFAKQRETLNQARDRFQHWRESVG